MNKKSQKLVLIDGNALIHRAYHALPPLTTKGGELVNAVYGFTSVLLKVISEIKPKYIVATFDLKAPTFRHKEYADYKATRMKAPDELYAQIERVKEVVRAFGIPIYEQSGFEADDVIGTLVCQAENAEENIENIIVTGDLDALQLISSQTKVYALRRGMSDTVIYGEEEVLARYGLRTDQMIDYKGLRGDPSDNIPGVKGIGEKTAVSLLKKYKTIEGVYANLLEIKGAVKDKLERDKMQAFMSKRLATIRKDVPLILDFSKAHLEEFDREKLVELFKNLNFFSLIKRIPENSLTISEKETGEKNEMADKKEVADFKFEIITEEKLDEFLEELKKQEVVALASKTIGGKKYFDQKIEGLAFSWKTGRAKYIFWNEKTKEKLKSILENEKINKIGFDLKADLEVLMNYKVKLRGIHFDVLLAKYVLSPGEKINFSEMVLEEIGEEFSEAEKKSGQLGLSIESESDIAKKICQKADYIWKLKSILTEKIKSISAGQSESKNIQTIFERIEMPLVPILAEMEMNGIYLNKKIFSDIADKLSLRISALEKAIYKLAGEQFNINSPKQLAEILFQKLGIPTDEIKKGKTGFSTASSELQKIKKESLVISRIEEYRELFKLKTTYLDALPELCDNDSRIHTSFNQAVTATGRLSSSDPNLQNIPAKTDLGQFLRTAFEAPKGWKLVGADYSQIDLRVVAHVSADKKMIETFLRGEDIHKTTAAEINKVPLSKVTEKMRNGAKALNFGIIYGMSVFGFSLGADIEREEAKKFIDEYMSKFSGVANYMRETKMSAKEKGFVETLLGRRRYLPEINSSNFMVKNSAERMAINMPIQGLAADIMKLATIEAEKLVEKYSSKVRTILQIHDELIFEVREDVVKDFSEKIKKVMEEVYSLRVPLVVDVKVGNNWGEI